jgi:hypothetical protein
MVIARRGSGVAADSVENGLVSMDEVPQHVALPKLYGGPAYARPPAPVAHTPRPIDVDDLPIAAYMTDDEMQLLASLPDTGGRVLGVRSAVAVAEPPAEEPIHPRPFSIRGFADRIRRPRA